MFTQLKRHQNRVITDPPFMISLLNDARLSVLWLVARVWLGYQWLNSAWGKLGNPAWVETGEALKGYWTNADHLRLVSWLHSVPIGQPSLHMVRQARRLW
jgi:hypothetical protein